MNALTPELVREVTAKVLEDAAFIFSEPAEGGARLTEGLEARLQFSGERSGTARLRCSPGFATELAAGLLGVEPDDAEADADQRAALGELLNMIAGLLGAELFGTELITHLGIPVVTPAFGPDGNPTCGVALTVGDAGQRLEVDLELAGA